MSFGRVTPAVGNITVLKSIHCSFPASFASPLTACSLVPCRCSSVLSVLLSGSTSFIGGWGDKDNFDDSFLLDLGDGDFLDVFGDFLCCLGDLRLIGSGFLAEKHNLSF